MLTALRSRDAHFVKLIRRRLYHFDLLQIESITDVFLPIIAAGVKGESLSLELPRKIGTRSDSLSLHA
jgi:hypothetical protein